MGMLDTIFGGIDVDGVFDKFKNLENTLFVNNDWLKPHYRLSDNGETYSVTVKYDDNRDRISVRTDKDKHLLQVTVYEDWDKINAISACSYYGSFTMTAPEDCDLEHVEKTINKEEGTITVIFKKIVKPIENKSEENEQTAIAQSNEIDYKAAYEKLHEKYSKEVSELKEKNMSLRSENEDLQKKFNDIKKLFN